MEIVIIIAGIALFGAFILDRIARMPDKEFIREYREILLSNKYRIKGPSE